MTQRPPRPSTTGVLVIDKPAGMTSMDVVAVVRRRAGGARTGHAGTLDPLATGVLLVALGRATKSIDRFMATDKAYETRIDLGAFTATDDLEADREEVAVSAPPGREEVERALEEFRGTFPQRPPAYSAVKVGGRPAYKLARRGETAELKPRPVTVHALEIVRYEWPRLDLTIRCAKGLYVRSLARDLGTRLGTGGHCISIRRTAVGPFTIEEATPVDGLPETLTEDDLTPLAAALDRLPAQPSVEPPR